ncbi:metal ABC transporter permease [Sporolactobacillus spathodeae]|uniref:Zinc/manganese transport system permease protein n=1 Tax=Sporolactobacillus spathodeae TaxID=1465502 RepID=A0ABS2QB66_9BACL|nr:metal ABC transporter permease [Sporolactobacillus spathodeae]MBM7659005.1 zinc/manganese transport system permease protein [Sporolactobacillus spathodeae]
MFAYDFMRHAFIAGTLIAIMCGAIGVFIMARNLSFIAHTFSHIGFAGASFAVFAGLDPLIGLLLFTLLGACGVGQLGVRVFRRDAAVSVILSLALGLGILFLSLSDAQGSFTKTILFGSVVGIDLQDVWQLVGLTLFVLLVLAVGYRWLKFDSFDQTGAEAAGLPVHLISIGFLLLMAVAVSVTVQIVGALLVFALMTVPAAAARFFTQSIFGMILTAALLAMAGVWFGLSAGYYTNAPVSFYIVAFEALSYFVGLLYQRVGQMRRGEA